MKRIFGIAILVFIATSILPVLGLAHHSIAQFTNSLSTMDGTVVEYRWRNPHVIVVWDSTDANGKVVRWVGELSSIATLMGHGLTKDSLKAGDAVKMSVYPSKAGTPESVVQYIQRKDGSVVLGWSQQAGGDLEGRLARQRRPLTDPPKE
jgi:Family of unknown function (DUF6152)